MSRRRTEPGRSNRRRFLKASGIGAVSLALAGCSGESPGGQTPTEGEGSPTSTETEGMGTESPTPTPTVTPEPVDEGEKIPRGGTFVVGLPSPPKGLNALSTSSAYSWAILDNVHEAGTALEPVNFTVNPSAYTDWTVENVDSGEPDVYFDVREGLTWNDGESFGVDDVLFTYEYMMDQQPGRYVSTLQPIDSVEEASTDYDLHMRLSQPIGTYEVNQLQLPLLAEHVWSNVDDFQKYQPGKQVPQRPVGLGPARVTKYAPDTAIEIEFRDPEEYQLSNLQWRKDHENLRAGGPFIDQVRFKVYSSSSKMHQDWFEGNLDSFFGSIRGSRVNDAKDAEGKSLIQGSDTGYGYMAFNTRRRPFDDISFRQVFGFLWDDVYWTRRLNRNLQIEGDFVIPPGYKAVRPETGAGVEMLTHPATQAFHFRQSTPGVPDLDAIRAFLTEGNVITGESGTYVGQDYPGSLTGVRASQTEAKHDYSFGPVQSSVLQEHGAEKELRVNGKTLTEIHGRPLEYLMYPPQLVPELTKMDKQYTQTLKDFGIPVERSVQTFNTLLNRIYVEEDFDIYHMGWGGTSPFGVSSLYNIFHSDNADDHSVVEEGTEEENARRSLNNAMAYSGADDLISQARTEMNTEERNRLVRRAVERIYLDFPYMVFGYDKMLWPVNSAEFAGFVEGIPGPGGNSLATQFMNLHRTG